MYNRQPRAVPAFVGIVTNKLYLQDYHKHTGHVGDNTNMGVKGYHKHAGHVGDSTNMGVGFYGAEIPPRHFTAHCAPPLGGSFKVFHNLY